MQSPASSCLVFTYTHDKRVLVLGHTLVDLVCNSILGHLWRLVVGGDRLVGRNKVLLHVTSLERERLLYTAIEEECDVGVLLRLGNVDLLHVLLAQPLGQNIVHALRLECNLEGIVDLILGHGDEVKLGVREVGKDVAVDVAQYLGDLAHTV